MESTLAAGTIFANKYEILSLAGSGGMGAVYKARQVDLERVVALKMLDPLLVADNESRQRFIREAQSINRLENSHIAKFYAYDISNDGLPFIVMEYIEGQSLRSALLSEGSFGEPRMLNIAQQVCLAIAHAHAQGIIHRDLKPENIILLQEPEPDFVKIIDFGLAKLQLTQNSGQKLTKTGELIGSVHYLSPEQCSGHAADNRSDIYALGCICYEMLCRKPPFDAENPVGLIYKHANEKAIAPSLRAAKEFSEGIDALILKMLAKNPNKRFQSMDELSAAIARLQGVDAQILEERSIKPLNERRRPPAAKLLTLLLLPASGFFYLSTDPGKIAFAKLRLYFDHSESSFAKAAELAIKLEETGVKQDESKNLWKSIEKARPEPGFCEFLLKLANEKLSSGDTKTAASIAKLAFLKTLDQLRITKDSTQAKELWTQLDKLSAIMLKYRGELSQFNSRETKNFIQCLERAPNACAFISLDLAGELIKEMRLSPSDLLCEILRRRDYADCKQDSANSAKILSDVQQTTWMLRETCGENSMRIPQHLAAIARSLTGPFNVNRDVSMRLSREAEKLSSTANEKDPDMYSSILFVLGDCYRGNDENDLAEKYYKKALFFAEQYDSYNTNMIAGHMARRMLQQKKFAEAEKFLRYILQNKQNTKINPKMDMVKTNLFLALVDSLQAQKRDKEAASVLETAITQSKKNFPDSVNQAGLLLNRQFISYSRLHDFTGMHRNIDERKELCAKNKVNAGLRFLFLCDVCILMLNEKREAEAVDYASQFTALSNEELAYDEDYGLSKQTSHLLKTTKEIGPRNMHEQIKKKIISIAETARQLASGFRTFNEMIDGLVEAGEIDIAQNLIDNPGILYSQAPQWFDKFQTKTHSGAAAKPPRHK